MTAFQSSEVTTMSCLVQRSSQILGLSSAFNCAANAVASNALGEEKRIARKKPNDSIFRSMLL